MRFTGLLATLALAGLGAPFALGLGRADAGPVTLRPDILPVSALKPGMKGYGLTVFQGTEPERFDVEIIDVLQNFRPDQELILIKTKHPRLDVAKVVAGMSGSPIYINDKMIGAYAYGWSFGSEPVAGVTPIVNMLQDLARPVPKRIDGWPLHALPGSPSASLGQRRSTAPGPVGEESDPGGYDLMGQARALARRSAQRTPSSSTSALSPVQTPLLIGGMTPAAVGMAQELLAPFGLSPLQAGGGSAVQDPNAPTRFVDGGAIGVELVRGDMSAMGLGTVTRVEGDRLVAFGHPMMESGITALPTAIGKVLWFLASDMRSFKIGMPVRSVGALINDRTASIVVSHSAKAPRIPVELKIHGLPGGAKATWRFQVAHERFMSPSFVAIALGSALQAVFAERQDVSWIARSRLKIHDHGEIRVEDYGVAVGGTPDPGEFARSNLVQAMGAILNNPWEPARIESAFMDLELREGREILRLRGAEVLDPEVDAGSSARIRLTLIPFAGPDVVRVVRVPMPSYLAGETVKIQIAPGYTEARDRARAENLSDLIRNLQDPVYPPKSVIVSYATGSSAVSFKGQVAHDLPEGSLDAFKPKSSSIVPDSFPSKARYTVALPEFMVGQDQVTLKVRPVLR